MNSYKILIYLLLNTIGSSQLLIANDIVVSNVSLKARNTVFQTVMVQFDINWNNSWRTSSSPGNWDAAWVFVKFRIDNGAWQHAYLHNSGHNTGTGTAATITPGFLNTSNAFNATTNPAMGIFLYRSGNGSGTFSQTSMQLRWNYGQNGVSNDSKLYVKVFAIEMVYVPQGSFQLGDGTTNVVEGQFRNGSVNAPLTISSENAITLGGTGAGNLANNNASGMQIADDFSNSTTQNLAAAFPKGYNAFYSMKYEISQKQWIHFFNLLDNNQKVNRDITSVKGDALVRRNNISWSSGDATLNGGTYGEVACSYLSWLDGAAFADWASLRPISELEFEKACRGSVSAVSDEQAWGSTTISGATGINNSGLSNETASNSGANIAYDNNPNVQGPLRVGCFATSNSTREQSGSSFYGIMEMSGNLWEFAVSVGNATGRSFTGSVHGNGLLTSDGYCDIPSWPGYVSGKVTGATGSGFRGGSFGYSVFQQRVSSRLYASYADPGRYNDCGFRAIRTAQ